VLVSHAGVFVIEVKAFHGEIFGSIDSPKWVQQAGKSQRKFQNPIHQNYRHVSALRWQLSLRWKQLHSVIVFVGRATLRGYFGENVISTIAVGCPGLVRYIRSFEGEELSPNQLGRVVYELYKFEAAGFTEEDLLNSIHERKARERAMSGSGIARSVYRNWDSACSFVSRAPVR